MTIQDLSTKKIYHSESTVHKEDVETHSCFTKSPRNDVTDLDYTCWIDFLAEQTTPPIGVTTSRIAFLTGSSARSNQTSALGSEKLVFLATNVRTS